MLHFGGIAVLNNTRSRLASLAAAELARRAHSEALCIEGLNFSSLRASAISARQRTLSGSVSWRLAQVNAAGRGVRSEQAAD
jgi:hypothetical protein